jgi:pentatricopeptide repeat protein
MRRKSGNRPRDGGTVLPSGEIVEHVEFVPPDVTISSILRALVQECDVEDVAYVLDEIRRERGI